jgi:hypothetical protein
MILAYLSYPYTNNPEQNSEEVKKLAEKLVKRYPELCFILPHFASNWFKSSEDTESHCRAISYDIEFIKRSDIFVIGRTLNYSESMGCCWESCLAQSLGKKIYSADELLRGKVKFEVTN